LLAKVSWQKVRIEELAGDEICQGTRMLILLNDTIKILHEGWHFQPRNHKILLSFEICQRTVRGQFNRAGAFLLTARQ
jgi:hypothetical protein